MALKCFFYVVVQSEHQAKFVTALDNISKTALWEKDKKPLPLSQQYAEDLMYCLRINGYRTFIIKSSEDLQTQIFIKEN